MRTLLPALLAVALAACNADNITAVSHPATAVATDVWAGGFVTIHSQAFTSADSLPVVLLAGDTLPVSLTDTFTVSAELPDTVSGPLTLTVLTAAARDTQNIAVTAHGFVRAYPGPKLAGLPQRTPDGNMLALGTTGTVLVNAQDGVATPLGPDTAAYTGCMLTPGFSLASGVVVGPLQRGGSDCAYYAWRYVGGAPVVVDSGVAGRLWALAYLGPGRWIIGGKYYTYAKTDSSLQQLDAPIELNEYVADAAGRYLVPSLLPFADSKDVPVYSTATSSVAYYISGAGNFGGAGFSSDGDTLFVQRDSFLALDAATGKTLTEGPHDAYGGYMVVEPNRPWIYVIGSGRIPINGATTWTVGVGVIDRRTMTVVGHLEVPASAPQPIVFYDVLCPVLGPNNKLYVVDVTAWDGPPEPTRIYGFDLLP
ncbi:MAG TPA: hypothetical protein VJ992_06985 [Gemmatimonadales bacterium]|nr:hypothetical protein [Gemmatimonadales bacterium]